jgi:chemotaxis protein MotB
MSGGRRRGKGGHGGEFHLDERWMTSYADMITVLMCLFIVLYAMSTVDQKKYDELKNALASGFGVTNSKKIDLSEGVPVPKELVDKDGAGFTVSAGATELTFTKALAKEIQEAIKKAGGKASVKVTPQGVVIGLVGSSAYFDGNRASLRPDALTVLHAVAPIVGRGVENVTVEGHADPHGSSGPYATDWDLASARATNVLKYLVAHGTAAKRISAVSYGSAHSDATVTAAQREHNRRVDIVLHTRTAAATTTATTASATTETTKTKTEATHGSSEPAATTGHTTDAHAEAAGH